MKKILSSVLFIILTSCLSGCTICENDDSYYGDQIEELEQRVSELETENRELKDKLDNVQNMARSRNYKYSELLDDIEDESEY